MARCSRCRTLKEPAAFYRDQRRRNGLTSECRACRAVYKREVRNGVREQRERRLCDRCNDRQHGPRCLGCDCHCRPMLGFDGPFEFGDPTAPSVYDQEHRHDDEDQAVA